MGVAHPSVVLAGVAEVTASIGVALASHLDERPESVLRRAIKAGNHAQVPRRRAHRDQRRAGVDRRSPRASSPRRSRATSCALHYLPIVSCATGRVAGFEALVRWEHPEHGLLLPGEFLPDAEATGLDRARRHVDDRAGVPADGGSGTAARGATLKLEPQPLGPPVRRADPARAGEADHRRAPASRRVRCGSRSPRPRCSHDRDASERTLRQLHELGVRLVIDDFGTGASSLVSLQAVPARRDQDRLDVRRRPRS